MTSISQFELATILLVLTAAFSWVNYGPGLMPRTIGLLVMGLGASLVVIEAKAAVPGLVDYEDLAGLVRQVDFEVILLHGMPTYEIEEDLRGAVVIGRGRTSYQDLNFPIRRIVELAQRSLSPGINDPTIALYCTDRLGEVLDGLAGREIPSAMRVDDSGQLRVVTEVVTLRDVA